MTSLFECWFPSHTNVPPDQALGETSSSNAGSWRTRSRRIRHTSGSTRIWRHWSSSYSRLYSRRMTSGRTWTRPSWFWQTCGQCCLLFWRKGVYCDIQLRKVYNNRRPILYLGLNLKWKRKYNLLRGLIEYFTRKSQDMSEQDIQLKNTSPMKMIQIEPELEANAK